MQQPGGQTWNRWTPILNVGAGHHWPPRWRRPCWGPHRKQSSLLIRYCLAWRPLLRHINIPELSWPRTDFIRFPFQHWYLSNTVVHNLFYNTYPFFKQGYQIYPQYIQWCEICSFIEKMELSNFYSLEWFIKICIGCNLRFSKFTPLKDEIYPLERWNLPQVMDHWSNTSKNFNFQRPIASCYPSQSFRSALWVA